MKGNESMNGLDGPGLRTVRATPPYQKEIDNEEEEDKTPQSQNEKRMATTPDGHSCETNQ